MAPAFVDVSLKCIIHFRISDKPVKFLSGNLFCAAKCLRTILSGSCKDVMSTAQITNETKENYHHCNIKVGREMIVQAIIQALLDKHRGQRIYE